MARRSPHPPIASPDFEQALATLGEQLEGLRQRYQSVCADQQRQGELRQALGIEAAETVDPELAATLGELQRELTELEARLDSQFMSWDGVGTLFWQVVRFVGLGLVLGWGLRSWVG
ncbi:hypothetical protein [Prochlorothrix hollandica]|uniref:hypothetical protein n=1 Tax=Prochlorothrix hollandica TaxID=1223 RepID=UPI00333F9E43